MYVLAGFADVDITYADDKAALIQALAEKPEGVVILDYTLFDLDGPEELFILSQRFRLVQWLLFSEELSLDFVRVVIAEGSQYGLLLKDSSLGEIRAAINATLGHRRFICQHMAELYHGVDHLIHFIVSERIEDLKPLDVEAALGCCGLNLVHVAYQDRRQKAVFFQSCGGLEDTGVGTLGVDDLAGICLEYLYQIFKHF